MGSHINVMLIAPSFLGHIGKRKMTSGRLSTLLTHSLLMPVMRGAAFRSLHRIDPLLKSEDKLDAVRSSVRSITTGVTRLIAMWANRLRSKRRY